MMLAGWVSRDMLKRYGHIGMAARKRAIEAVVEARKAQRAQRAG